MIRPDESIKSSRALSLAGALRVTADDLDPVCMDLVCVVELEVDVFDDESPDIVAEAVGVEMSLYNTINMGLLHFGAYVKLTLKVSRDLTLSESTSATALSKLIRIFIAS